MNLDFDRDFLRKTDRVLISFLANSEQKFRSNHANSDLVHANIDLIDQLAQNQNENENIQSVQWSQTIEMN